MSYPIISGLPTLGASVKTGASYLSFKNYAGGLSTTWDNTAEFVTSSAVTTKVFSFEAYAGATYSFTSKSFFEPLFTIVFDQDGSPIKDEIKNDGSYGYNYITDFVAPYTGKYYVATSFQQGMASANKVVVLLVTEDRDTAPNRGAIVGDDASQSIGGTDRGDEIYGRGGDDRLFGWGGDDYLDGGSGIDTAVYAGAKSSYTITIGAGSIVVQDKVAGRDGRDTLVGVERLEFGGTTYAMDASGNAGKAYRLYQASLDRTPDKIGLGFHIKSMDQGADIGTVANSFVNSSEFSSKYGSLSNEQFVAQLYRNILHREAEAGGRQYWTGLLDQAVTNRAGVLAGFSESDENIAALTGVMSGGIEFTPYG